jgi:lipid A ethanolaminephosphotransferase
MVAERMHMGAITANGVGEGGWLSRRPELSEERLVLLISLLAVALLNASFWSAAAAHRSPASPEGMGFLIAIGVCLVALHAFLFGVVGIRGVLRPALALSWTIGVLVAYYTERFTVYVDPGMLRNVLHTQPKEAIELVTPAMLSILFAASAPVWLLLAWIRPRPTTPGRWLLRRSLWLAACLLVAVAAALCAYRDLSPWLRNHREVRYLVTPANAFVSAFTVLRSALSETRQPRQPIGTDAVVRREQPARPRLLVLVIGETVRAQNWGLNGYSRDTTPLLRQRRVINFADVSACGSDTEVSLPCMFAPIGRRDYDQARIRSQQSLLHVLERAGVGTLWLDNQSGCKGVCEGLAFEGLRGDEDPGLCDGRVCLDGVLFERARQAIAKNDGQAGDRVLLLHQLGNHGPAYSRRYPEAFRQFTPACEDPDLKGCDQRSITNSYDNAILYTDHLLAGLIDTLSKRDDLDSALLYLSDHGESLGEGGIYLHGLPYMIAPPQQLKVPMTLWLSDRLARSAQIDSACLAARSNAPLAHDHLFHTVLGLFAVDTTLYEDTWDVLATCRRQSNDLASFSASD